MIAIIESGCLNVKKDWWVNTSYIHLHYSNLNLKYHMLSTVNSNKK